MVTTQSRSASTAQSSSSTNGVSASASAAGSAPTAAQVENEDDEDEDEDDDDQDFDDWVDDEDEDGLEGQGSGSSSANNAIFADAADAAKLRGPKTPTHALFPETPDQPLKLFSRPRRRWITPRSTGWTSVRLCAPKVSTRCRSFVCSTTCDVQRPRVLLSLLNRSLRSLALSPS